jgi:2',3'-cyclic-nucleotide 2'-phosphodiesterase (5'-nucleotidase family)
VAYDRVELTIDRALGTVVSKRAAVPETRHAGISPDPAVAALVERYRRRVAPLAEHVVGEAAQELTRANGRLAQLAADAQRAFAGADVALVNPASLRGDVAAGAIAYAELFAAQAYDHRLLRFELSGAELQAVLARLGDRVAVAGDAAAVEAERPYAVVANELFATSGAFPADAITAAQPVGSEVEATFTSLSQARNRAVTASPRPVAKVR